jgi:hypothetical protein
MITTALHYYSAQFQAMPGVVEHPQYGLLIKYLLGERGGVASRTNEMYD